MRNAIKPLSRLLLWTVALTAQTGMAAELEVVNEGAFCAAALGDTLVDPDLALPVGLLHKAPDFVQGYPGWYASGDVLLLKRNRARDVVISVDDNGTLLDLSDDTPLITGHDLPFNDYETGYRIQLGRSLGNGLALEGQFFQVSEWDTQASVTTNGLLSGDPDAEAISIPVPFDAGPFSQAVQQISTYRSDLLSAELNVKATWRNHHFLRSELIGFRYVQVRENFNLFSLDETTSTPTNGIGTYDVETDNNLLGVQLGEEIGFTLFQRLCLSTQIKAGAFVNSNEQRTRVTNSSFTVFNIRETDANAAFVGELNVNANLKLTRMLSIRGGYNFLWVDGLVLGPEQDFPAGVTGRVDLNDNGGLFYHGFSVGLEFVR